MADDLDQLIRAAMKTLDDEVPSGYFDALPNRTLTRLEGSMQHGSSGTSETREQVAPPPMTAADSSTSPVAAQAAPAASAREEDREDSGLHDIRNLAQSTKQRLSSRRITAPPIEDDVLASSSGSFKNIALPQPAKMVSLPELAELPPAAEVAAADKAAKKAAKEAAKARKSEPAIAAAAPATTPVEAPAAAPSAAVAPARQAFSLPSQQQKKSKGPLIALVGTGLAAAAGVVIFMQVNKSADTAQAPAAAAPAADTVAVAPAAAPTVEPIEQPAPPPVAAEPPVEEAKDEPAVAAAAQIAADEGKAEDKNEDKAPKKARAKATKKADKEETAKPEAAPAAKADAKADGAKPAGAEPEPSFDALLKEAGVVEKKEAKPKLAKKSLTGSDFKTGMKPVTAKAKACYTGTQGIAMIKLTVAPSGQVSKVAVTGAFAGKSEASCVESAVKAATFPPWDGGPQSFTYSVLLSD